MADNIMGPEVNLGLNVNLDLDQSAQDAATLADQIKQMRVDQEAFRDVIADTNDRLREMTSEFQEQLSLRQQMLDAEQSLRNLSDSRTQSLQDQVNAYREMEQSMSRLGQTMAGASMPYMGGMGGMGGMSGFYGGSMGGFYNPMSGMMSNFGGFPSAFSGTPAEEAEQAEEIYREEDQTGTSKLKKIAKSLNELTNEQTASGKILHHAIPRTLLNNIGTDSLIGRTISRLPAGLVSGIEDYALGAGPMALLGGAARFAGPVGAAVTTATLGYKVVGDVLRTGQEYGALTGSASPVGGYEADIQARLGSLFNPLMPYGVSKQIESTGLAAGYKLGENYLNGYRDFASGAFERYQMSPGEAQSMFQNAVVRAGATSDQLSKALQNVAQNAANTGTNFKIATENLNGAIQVLTPLGLSGKALTGASTVLANQFSGGNRQTTQILSGVQDQMNNFFGNVTGQALLANSMGTNWSHLYSAMAGMQGGAKGAEVAAYEDKTIMRLMSNLGIHHGSTVGQIRDQAMNMSMMFQQLGMNIDPQTAVNLAQYMFNNTGALERKLKPAPNKHDYQYIDTSTGQKVWLWNPNKPGQPTGHGGEWQYKQALKKYNDEKNQNPVHKILQDALNGTNTQKVQVEFTGKAKEWFQTHGPKNSGN